MIGIIDSDLIDSNTRFPNLALMKISSYQQSIGNETKLITYDEIDDCDEVYLSRVFDHTSIPDGVLDHVNYGGTGFYFDKAPPLQTEVEHMMPDYNLYDMPDKTKYKYYNKASIGFTTRGCFRQCQFCVNRNYTRVHKWSPVSEFYDSSRRYIVLLDDNILGSADRMDVLRDLESYDRPVEFNQGLDIRLLNDNVSEQLASMKYHGTYTFAFDNWNDRHEIIPALDKWLTYGQYTALYLFTAFKSQDTNDIHELLERIRICQERNVIPYVMRFKDWKNSEMHGMYVNISRWCNQPSMFKKLSLSEFVDKHKDTSATVRVHNTFTEKYPDIAREFFDLKWR